MSQYRLYVHEKGPLKVAPERGIYENPQGWKCLRVIKEEGKESFLPCGTRSVTGAIRMRDARATAKAVAGLGIAVSPDEATKTATITIAKVIQRYAAHDPGRSRFLQQTRPLMTRKFCCRSENRGGPAKSGGGAKTRPSAHSCRTKD